MQDFLLNIFQNSRRIFSRFFFFWNSCRHSYQDSYRLSPGIVLKVYSKNTLGIPSSIASIPSGFPWMICSRISSWMFLASVIFLKIQFLRDSSRDYHYNLKRGFGSHRSMLISFHSLYFNSHDTFLLCTWMSLSQHCNFYMAWIAKMKIKTGPLNYVFIFFLQNKWINKILFWFFFCMK